MAARTTATVDATGDGDFESNTSSANPTFNSAIVDEDNRATIEVEGGQPTLSTLDLKAVWATSVTNVGVEFNPSFSDHSGSDGDGSSNSLVDVWLSSSDTSGSNDVNSWLSLGDDWDDNWVADSEEASPPTMASAGFECFSSQEPISDTRCADWEATHSDEILGAPANQLASNRPLPLSPVHEQQAPSTLFVASVLPVAPPQTETPSLSATPAASPTADPACCPFCQSADTAEPVTNVYPEPWKFARYQQRKIARKDNHLAPWYRKYGYAGPPYCKACSEKFCSHLLRKNAKTATRRRGPKGICSRDEVCEVCAAILDNFNVTPEELYSKFDSRRANRNKCSKSSLQTEQGVGRETTRVMTSHHDLSTGTDGSHKEREPPSKQQRIIPGMLAALATIVFSWGVLRRFYEAGGSSPIQETWECGADMNLLVGEALVRSTCTGADPSKLFSCSVNECAAAGKLPIGERTCRCDGCYKPGRCGGWVLQGHSMAAVETGRECTRFEVQRPQQSRLSWRVPMDVDCATCEQFAKWEHAAQSKCGNHLQTTEKSLTRGTGSPCELISAYAWPQPVAGPEELVPTYTHSHPTPVREGVIWSAGGFSTERPATLWLYNTLTPSELMPPGFELWMEDTSHEHNSSDVHIVWKFEPVDGVWLPQNSPIGSTRHPRLLSGAGTWTDSSGSLFVFGGTDPEVLATQWMWRYDTYAQKWEPLGPGTVGSVQITWPVNRVRATIWIDRCMQDFAVDAIWMFGGTGTGTGKGSMLPLASGSSELWRYHYEHQTRALDDLSTALPNTTVSGEWQLVSIQEAEVRSRNLKEWLLYPIPQLCTDWLPVQATQVSWTSPNATRKCPEGRVDAGSWASISGHGGWIFGGTAFFVDPTVPAAWKGQLQDLWQFSVVYIRESKLDTAAKVVGSWRQVIPEETNAYSQVQWPPAWNRPAGWVDEHNGGSLWISGATGQQHDELCLQVPGEMGRDCTTTSSIDPDSSKRRSDLWRFDLASERWEHIQANVDFGTPGQTAWHIPWPAKRQRAVLSVAGSKAHDVFMLGGIGMKECSDGELDDDDRFLTEYGDGSIRQHDGTLSSLNGLWRWEETSESRP